MIKFDKSKKEGEQLVIVILPLPETFYQDMQVW